MSVKTFVYDNNIFEIRTAILGERLCVRVFLNGEKIWDVQDAFEENVKYNAIIFTTGEYKDDNKFFISNIYFVLCLLSNVYCRVINTPIKEGKYCL